MTFESLNVEVIQAQPSSDPCFPETLINLGANDLGRK